MSKSKSLLLFLNLVIMFASCTKQLTITPTSKLTNLAVVGPKFKGVIFTENYIITPAPSTFATIKRFTPTKDDILLAEYLIKDQLSILNKNKINQIKGNPVIEKHLRSYFRQYVGYINPKGDRVIHINFHWSRYSITNKLKGAHDDRLSFEDDYTHVFDGGSYYWQINVNLTTRVLYDLEVNGFG